MATLAVRAGGGRSGRAAGTAARRRQRWRHRLVVLSFMAPALVSLLLFLGYPPLIANVSNTIGLVPGAISGTIGRRRPNCLRAASIVNWPPASCVDAQLSPPAEVSGGRGLWLTRLLCDAVEVCNAGGCIVTMHAATPSQQPATAA